MFQLFPPEIIENTVECYHARIIDSDNLRKINGGYRNFFVPSEFSDGTNLPLFSYFASTGQTTDLKLW
ncbi:MAG: hypothetical protein PHH37_02410 [Paludibacter sp.]|nr:hypothetical protein [Paludibacter sp.]